MLSDTGFKTMMYLPTKDDLIFFAANMAGAIDPAFLQDINNPVRVVIAGDPNAGKSQIADTFIITLQQGRHVTSGVQNIFSGINFVNVDEEETFQITTIDRRAESYGRRPAQNLQDLRQFGGIDLIQHPTEEDIRSASVRIGLATLDTPEDPAFILLSNLRSDFGISSDPKTLRHNGMRTLQMDVHDRRLQQSRRFADFYGQLHTIYAPGLTAPQMATVASL